MQSPVGISKYQYDFKDLLLAKAVALRALLDATLVRRLARLYGTDARTILDGAKASEDLGHDFGHGLTEAEVRYLMKAEWARSADDILFRRTKLGIRMSEAERQALADWMAEQAA